MLRPSHTFPFLLGSVGPTLHRVVVALGMVSGRARCSRRPPRRGRGRSRASWTAITGGAKIIARTLRHAGMEVIYAGLHQTPDQIETAIQEDADAVGVSILSGAHMTRIPLVVQRLRDNAADDVLILVGGTIPPGDAEELRAQGVAAVFTPGTPTSENANFFCAELRR